MTAIEAGKPAPDFELPADGGGLLRLSALSGSKVVLYFYPTDDTETCTAEALGFSALAAEFEAADTIILGISRDNVRSHDRFKEKYGLALRLASDEDGSVVERYGVWQQKQMFGHQFMGIVRTTLLIDRDGTIVRIWPRVRIKGHAEAVLAAARAI